MGKRKHESNGVHEIVLDDEGEEQTLNSTVEVVPKKKKKRDDAEIEMEEHVIDVWLVKKPKSMTIEELANVRIPRKVKTSNRERYFELPNGNYVSATFENPSKSMFYFKAQERIQNLKDNKKIRSLRAVKGIATVRPYIQVDDPFPCAVEETEEMNTEVKNGDLPFEIKSIRRQPGIAEGPDRKLDAANANISTERSKLKKPKKENVEFV
ncbi:hypothetical protein M3Y96_01053800 [Aphelenchoides besseyi]|nr:hypothetical protein M3Y96_01053800 [Aphelenchoides besseyi]